MVQWQTVYETNSGQLPQQDFTYVEVEPGQGSFVWFDYNGNGIQELEEFETAQFQDQASYIRVLLPNQNFIRTHQNRLSQSIIIDPIIIESILIDSIIIESIMIEPVMIESIMLD